MKTVKNLDITKDYKIVGTRYSKDEPTTCDNCNKIITNIVILEDSNGKLYNVGTECTKTIHYFTNTFEGNRALKQAEKILKDTSKFHNFVKKQLSSFERVQTCYSLFDKEGKKRYRVSEEYLKQENLLQYIDKLKGE